MKTGRQPEGGLLGYWPLDVDARDATSSGLDGKARHVAFRDGAAILDGVESVIEVAKAGTPDLKGDPFTLAAWICTERGIAGPIGDIISRFDPEH
ncbi:MAG: hypothetical protein V1790_09835, partial [Planctomycetota bacterium]